MDILIYCIGNSRQVQACSYGMSLQKL